MRDQQRRKTSDWRNTIEQTVPRVSRSQSVTSNACIKSSWNPRKKFLKKKKKKKNEERKRKEGIWREIEKKFPAIKLSSLREIREKNPQLHIKCWKPSSHRRDLALF